jgi:hypothetical protein
MENELRRGDRANSRLEHATSKDVGGLRREGESLASPSEGCNAAANAAREANGLGPESSIGSCQLCLRKLKRQRSSQRFCSKRCRLLFWAARQLVKERASGNAGGIASLLDGIL